MSDRPTPYKPAEGADFYPLSDLPCDGTWEYRMWDGDTWTTRGHSAAHDVASFVEARPIPKPPVMVEVPAERVVDWLAWGNPRVAAGNHYDNQPWLDAAWAALDAAEAES